MLMMCFMRWRWCLRRACSAWSTFARRMSEAEPVMSYFDKLGDKLRHLHIVDSGRASDTHYIPEKAKCRCGN